MMSLLYSFLIYVSKYFLLLSNKKNFLHIICNLVIDIVLKLEIWVFFGQYRHALNLYGPAKVSTLKARSNLYRCTFNYENLRLHFVCK